MKVIVIKPKFNKLLFALKEIYDLKLGEFILVGNKLDIIEKLYSNNIQSKQFTIYDIDDDFLIMDFCINLIKGNSLDCIIFDDYPKEYQNKLIGCEDERLIGNLDILDIPFLRHFLFLSNYSQCFNIDFDDKKNAILQANKTMDRLGIKKVNAAMVTNQNSKTDLLETNVISMIIKENNLNNINIYDNFTIANLFIKESKVNIYKSNINLLIMKNYETSRIFLDTLKVFTNIKIASFILGNCYGINVEDIKDENNLLFSLIVLNKIFKEKSLGTSFEKDII